MKDDPNALVRRNALKRIGVTAVTGLSLALHPSSEGGHRKESGVKAEQPAKKPEEPAKKKEEPAKKKEQPAKKTNKRIAEYLPREKANLLTSRARNVSKEDLLALDQGKRTAATASLTVKDLNSLKTAFGSNRASAHLPPSGSCCCCCDDGACCCCCGAE